MVRLPPLNALRSFEAAARNLSFSKAASELNVTPAAISHQIKGLEDFLGVKLFRRLNRVVMLTDAGQAYLPGIREGFQKLYDATVRLQTVESSGVLTISTLSSIASRWLVPRLRRFQERYPDIDVRLTTSDHLVDFAREDVDIAIRYGTGHYPGLHSVRFLEEEYLYPVCSPALLAGARPLQRPEDLAFHTLLHDDMKVDWAMWLTAAGVQGVDPKRGPAYTDSSMVLQAAVEGHGVALGRSALAADDLEAGRLVKPFEIEIASTFAYYVVSPETTAEQPKIAAFREWILSEAQRDRDNDATVPIAVR
ncbi:transcriptional regulator GcvA [Oceanibacterium hippocampi]|uniref:Glycine cleavage system transcriptional activator n=1 Tax=Oceanibacterium hippocampi TaxID=745714 RepID=A0A1Y5TW40_9PROT|nr:transcriptional regulator GcvA [Oceanibacterium hippocampi]SLN74359.1 Glycine cleavage system transcriptional activator [Oceanibacterium hippocampi]